MVFNSLPFLVFLPLFLVAYFSSRGRDRLGICLIASYIFYGWWDWRFLGLIALSTLIDFVIGNLLEAENDERKRRLLLTLSIVANLGMLATFKYFHFFADSLVAATARAGIELSQPTFEIILPVGISFFTFQTMSYSIDVFRRQCEAEKSLIRFATFVAFFPQLVAGPIVRASRMLPELRVDQSFCWQRFLDGAMLIVWGFVLKSVVADSLALVVDARFASPHLQNGLSNLIGVVFYAFQIYCDFNGYSMIAIGIGRVLGFDFGTNFRRPYFSTSFSEFWQRWHISLSSWLRDYLYIPLGGNRCGPARTQANLMITMLLGGLWHGASWRFVVWGGLHGLYLIVQRLIGMAIERAGFPNVHRSLWFRALSVLTVFSLTCVAWVFFRAESFDDALNLLKTLVNVGDYSVAAVGQKFHVAKGAALILALAVGEFVVEARPKILDITRDNRYVYAGSMAAMLWTIALLGTFSNQSFIYFRF